MPRYASIGTAAALALAIVSCAVSALWFGPFGGSSTARSDAAVLPTACDNFVEAARQLAQGGSGGVQTPYGSGFLAAPTAGAYDTLKTLLDACDDQLVEMTSH